MRPPDEGFRVFEIDPPWKRESGGGKIKRGADRHYGLLSNVEVVQCIRDAGIWRRDSRGVVAFMWATTSTLIHGDVAAVLKGLELVPASAFAWAKVEAMGETADGRPLFSPAARSGLGQWTRHEHEHLIVARSDDVDARTLLPPKSLRQRSVIYAPRVKATKGEGRGDVDGGDEHSTKPAEAIARLMLTSQHLEGHRLEIFARVPRPGVWTWGTLDGPRKPARLAPPDDNARPFIGDDADIPRGPS